MALIGVFGVCLLLWLLVSGTTARWVLSAVLIFLVGGAVATRLRWVSLRPDSPVVDAVLSLALFVLLFVEGAALQPRALRRPGAKVVGAVVLAVAAVALLVRFLVGFDAVPAVIIAAVLAPMGPLLASLGRRSTLLGARSAVITGLALPLLVIMVSVAGHQPVVSSAVLPLAGGLALGVALPAAAYLLVRLPGLSPGPRKHPLIVLAVAVIVYAVAHLTGVNPFLAALAAGVTLGALDADARAGFAPLADQLATVAGCAAMLIFGALLTPAMIRGTTGLAWLAAVLVVIILRPAAAALALSSRRAITAAWLEPQPFTTVLLALLVLRSGIPGAPAAYAFLAVAVVAGIVLHSASDAVVARLSRSEPASSGSAT